MRDETYTIHVQERDDNIFTNKFSAIFNWYDGSAPLNENPVGYGATPYCAIVDLLNNAGVE